MKQVKMLTALGLLAVAGAANAEVSGSMGIASSYLWRGYDLGSGTPAISGDLHASAKGFYGGVWVSSGDASNQDNGTPTDLTDDFTNGTEYDLYAGYGGAAGLFNYDVSYWTYAYPTGGAKDTKGTPGKLSEAVVKLGVGPVKAFVNWNIKTPGSGDGDYQYYGITGTVGAFTALVARHDDQAQTLTHMDLTYAYNANLSFTVSKALDVANDKGYKLPKPTIVASYSVPFGK
jgi:uncharacterized protein (TIGR02001 family)